MLGPLTAFSRAPTEEPVGSPVNNGLPDPTTDFYALIVYVLAIDLSAPATLYAGTPGVVSKSTGGGSRWTFVNSGITNGEL